MSLPHASQLHPPQPDPDFSASEFQQWKYQFEDKIFKKLKERKVGEKSWFVETNKDHYKHAQGLIQEYLQKLGYKIKWVAYKKGF